MTEEIEKYVVLQEKRLSLLRMLAQEFMDCRKEFVSMDLDGIYRRITEQEDLCKQIESLRPAIEALQRTCTEQLGAKRQEMASMSEDPAWTERIDSVMVEIEEAQAQVCQLNQVQAAYLRRSRKTIQVLMNYFENFAMTYARPAECTFVVSRAAEEG